MNPGSEKEDPGKIAKEFEDLVPPPLSIDGKDEAIIKLRKERKGYREISKKLGVSHNRIADTLKEAGLFGIGTKRQEEQKKLLLFDEELIGSFLELPFDYFARRYGDFWKLLPDEKKKLTALSNKVASKWLPLWLERFADEAALGLTFGMIVYPRYLQTKELIEKGKIEAAKLKIEPQPTP